MSVSVAELKVLVDADISGLQRGLATAQAEMDRFGASAGSSSVGGGGGGLFGGLLGDQNLFSGALAAAGGAMERFGESLQGVGAQAGLLGGVLTLAVTRPLLEVGRNALQMAADFEQTMNVMAFAGRATQEQMGLLSAKAKQVGADLTLPNTSALDAASAMKILQQAGLSVKDTLDAVRPVAVLNAATNYGMAQSATLVATTLRAFGLEGKEAANIVDILAAATSRSTNTIGQYQEGIAAVGPVAKQYHVSVEDTVLALTKLGDAGIKGAAGGTVFRTMLERLGAPTNQAKELMNSLGIHVYDAQGRFKSLTQIIEEFHRGLGPTATITTAVGGDIEKMAKALEKAEKAAKPARVELERLPGVLRMEQLEIQGLQQRLQDVNDPVNRLTETLRHQETELRQLTDAMIRNQVDGLRKLGRENEDAKGNIAKTTVQLQLQREQLEKLKQEMTNMLAAGVDPHSDVFLQKKLEIIDLTNSIRTNKENLVDWKAKIADNARQLVQGTDATNRDKEAVDHLTQSIADNKKKLAEAGPGKNLEVAKLTEQIGDLTVKMGLNQQKMLDAQKALDDLQKAQANAATTTHKMSDEEKNHAEQLIFGHRAIKGANVLLVEQGESLQKLKERLDPVNAGQSLMIEMTRGLNGKIEGLKSQIETLEQGIGARWLPTASKFVKSLTDLIGHFGSLPPKTQDFYLKIAGAAAALGPGLVAFGGLAGILGTVLRVGGLLIAALSGGWGVALAAAGVAVLAYTKNWFGLKDAVDGAAKWLGQHLPAQVVLAGQSLGKFFADIGSAATHFFQELTVSPEKALANLQKRITDAFGALKTALGGDGKSLFGDLAKGLQPMVDAISKAWTDIKTFTLPIWNEISRFLKEIWPPIQKITETVWKAIGLYLQTLFRELGVLFKGTWQGFATIIKGAWDVIKGVVEVAWHAIALLFEVGLKALSGDWKGAWDSLKYHAKGILDGIRDIIKGTFEQILGYLATAVKMVANVGGQIITALADAIKAGGASVVQAIVGVVQAAIFAAKNALGIASPSKVFADIGAQVAAGYAHGIVSGAGKAHAALAQLLNPGAGGALATEGGGAFYARPNTSGGSGGEGNGGGDHFHIAMTFVGVQDAQSFRNSAQQVEEDLQRRLRRVAQRNRR